MRALVVVALVVVAVFMVDARADRTDGRNLWSEPPPPRCSCVTWNEAWRWELGAGVSGGWRPLADLRVRTYATEGSISAGLRFRFDLGDLAPRAGELEIGWELASGTMMFHGPARVHLMLETNGGLAHVQPDDDRLIGAFGTSLRIVPKRHDWLLFDLGVRELYLPVPAPTAALSAAQPTSRGFVIEGSLSVSILFPSAHLY